MNSLQRREPNDHGTAYQIPLLLPGVDYTFTSQEVRSLSADERGVREAQELEGQKNV